MPQIIKIEEYVDTELKEITFSLSNKIEIQATYYLIDSSGNKYKEKSFSLSEDEMLTTLNKKIIKEILKKAEKEIKKIEKI